MAALNVPALHAQAHGAAIVAGQPATPGMVRGAEADLNVARMNGIGEADALGRKLTAEAVFLQANNQAGPHQPFAQVLVAVQGAQQAAQALQNGAQALQNSAQALQNSAQALQNSAQALQNGAQDLQNNTQALQNNVQGFQALEAAVHNALNDSVRLHNRQARGGEQWRVMYAEAGQHAGHQAPQRPNGLFPHDVRDVEHMTQHDITVLGDWYQVGFGQGLVDARRAAVVEWATRM